MKNQRGITLVSLVLYVLGVTIIVGIVATITSFFYSNTQNINETTNSLGEFSKFNLEMIREVKEDGNSVVGIFVYSHTNEDGQDESGNDVYSWKPTTNGIGTRIIFSSGTAFTFVESDKGIYKNKVKICSEVTNCSFSKTMQEEKEIINVLFETRNFAKNTEYVINNKIIANANMEKNFTQIYSKQYVQDGLVLHYDAINNTGEGHSDTTTIWKDLSGNNNDGTMYNVLWGENGAVFNGDNSWVNCGAIESDYITICATFDVNSVTNINNQNIIGNWNSGGYGFCILRDGGVEGSFHVNGTYDIAQSDFAVSNGKVYNVVASYDGNNIILYVNGLMVDNNQVTGTIKRTSPTTVTALGTDPNENEASNNFLNGKIYSAAVYNRALTVDEVRQNYEIDKERYGIED